MVIAETNDIILEEKQQITGGTCAGLCDPRPSRKMFQKMYLSMTLSKLQIDNSLYLLIANGRFHFAYRTSLMSRQT